MEAGWHADPFGRYEVRYHNGTDWTKFVSTAGQQAEDPPIPSGDVPPPPPANPYPVAQPTIVHVEKRYICAKHGVVVPNAKTGKDITSKQKKMSGGKLAAGVMTGGLSLLATGVRTQKSSKTTILVCPMPMCGRTVTEL